MSKKINKRINPNGDSVICTISNKGAKAVIRVNSSFFNEDPIYDMPTLDTAVGEHNKKTLQSLFKSFGNL